MPRYTLLHVITLSASQILWFLIRKVWEVVM
nr:MAG TPA: hypothetical protein [Caudoviricetes sp.]